MNMHRGSQSDPEFNKWWWKVVFKTKTYKSTKFFIMSGGWGPLIPQPFPPPQHPPPPQKKVGVYLVRQFHIIYSKNECFYECFRFKSNDLSINTVC